MNFLISNTVPIKLLNVLAINYQPKRVLFLTCFFIFCLHGFIIADNLEDQSYRYTVSGATSKIEIVQLVDERLREFYKSVELNVCAWKRAPSSLWEGTLPTQLFKSFEVTLEDNPLFSVTIDYSERQLMRYLFDYSASSWDKLAKAFSFLLPKSRKQKLYHFWNFAAVKGTKSSKYFSFYVPQSFLQEIVDEAMLSFPEYNHKPLFADIEEERQKILLCFSLSNPIADRIFVEIFIPSQGVNIWCVVSVILEQGTN